MGAAILVIAFAVEIAAKGQNFSMAMLTVALIPFWYLVRSQIGSKDAPSSLQGFGGLFSSNPFSAWKMMIGLAAIVGVPPLPGFFFEDYALMVLMKHSPWAVVLAGLAVTINSVAGFRVFAIVTMGSVSKSKIHDASRLPATVGTAMESLPPGAFARMS